MVIRKTFPRIYKFVDAKSGTTFFQVSARSRKWGLNERKSFPTEKEAIDFAKSIENSLKKHGAPPKIPKEKLAMADAYLTLLDKLSAYGKSPEDAVEHYLTFLGQQVLNQAVPTISVLSEKWEAFKSTDSTLSKKTLNEVKQYSLYIRRTWGSQKPNSLARNDIDVTLRKLKVANNTRRKYLKFIRQFFSWIFDEGHISKNPTDGIFFRPDNFEARFYPPETTNKLLKYVAENHRGLIGYYALLTFAGLRPTEGTRVQWQDLNFKTSELYVRKGKTNARHIILEPVALEWMEWHRDQTPSGAPFVERKALPNREKEIRKAVLNGQWIQDGLRHGFATMHKNKYRDIALLADVMGNSPDVVKRHYARTIPSEECQLFWSLNPTVVLADEPLNN